MNFQWLNIISVIFLPVQACGAGRKEASDLQGHSRNQCSFSALTAISKDPRVLNCIVCIQPAEKKREMERKQREREREGTEGTGRGWNRGEGEMGERERKEGKEEVRRRGKKGEEWGKRGGG